MHEVVGATGTLQAVTTVQVGSQVSGTVQSLHADFNSQVTKGQVIARLDPSLLQARLGQSQAALASAQANVERSRATLLDAQQKLARAQQRLERPGAVIPMGEWGEAARILYARLGGFITYAAVERGRETAPGQLAVADLAHDYRVKSIDDATEVYAVFGDPVAHSQSPRLFNRA